MFASEIGIARALTDSNLGWVLAVAMTLIAIGFVALARNTTALLLGAAPPEAPTIAAPRSLAAALIVGVAACLVLGVAAGPLIELITAAAQLLDGPR
jgi:hydrogenase-4 component F